MIKGHDAESINETVLLETWKHPGSNKIRPVFTEIDRVLLLCNQCSHGPCEIDYWVRDEANITECKPQIPCCQKCPQWMCTPCCGCGGGGGTSIPITTDYTQDFDIIVWDVFNPYTDYTQDFVIDVWGGWGTSACRVEFDASEIPDSFFTSGNQTSFSLSVSDPIDHNKDFSLYAVPFWTGDMREDFEMSSPHGLGLALQNLEQEVLRCRIRYDNAKKIFVIFQDTDNPEGRPFDPYLPWEFYVRGGKVQYDLPSQVNCWINIVN